MSARGLVFGIACLFAVCFTGVGVVRAGETRFSVAAGSHPTMLAQTQTSSPSSRGITGRQTRGLIKLGVGAVVGAIALGGWVAKKVRGEGDSGSGA